MRAFSSCSCSCHRESTATRKTSRNVAVDGDKNSQLFRSGLSLDIDGALEDEDSEIGDIVLDRFGQGIIGLGGRSHQNGPELAVIDKGVIKLSALAWPLILDRLDAGRCFQEKMGLKLTRAAGSRRYLGCRCVRCCPLMHGSTILPRTQSNLWRLSEIYTGCRLICDC